MERVIGYLKSVRAEVRRVTWPTRNEVITMTALIIVLAVLMTLYIWGVDTILQAILRFFALL